MVCECVRVCVCPCECVCARGICGLFYCTHWVFKCAELIEDTTERPDITVKQKQTQIRVKAERERESNFLC